MQLPIWKKERLERRRELRARIDYDVFIVITLQHVVKGLIGIIVIVIVIIIIVLKCHNCNCSVFNFLQSKYFILHLITYYIV